MNEQRRKRLLRSRDDRILAGVAGGIANYLDVDPTLVRVGFVAATLFGGLGIAAYLVLAVVTPNDDGTGAAAGDDRPSAWLVVLAVLAVLILLPGPFFGPFLFAPFHWGGGWWWGGSLWLILLGAGAVWLFLTLRGRDRDSSPEERPPTEETGRMADESTAPTAEQPTQRAKSAGSRDRGHRVLRAIAIAVLVLAAVTAACCVTAISAWATATGHGAIVAGVVIAIGAVLAVAAFTGEARWRWLIAPALVLALPAGAVAAGDVHFDGNVGERQYTPASAASIPEDGYRLGVGQMTVDLRRFPWQAGDAVRVRTDMGLGQTVIAVPDRVCVDPDVTASAGEVTVRGTRSSGLDAELADAPPHGRAPRLVLDSEIDAGQIEVTDGPPEAITAGERFGHPGSDMMDDPSAHARALEACQR